MDRTCIECGETFTPITDYDDMCRNCMPSSEKKVCKGCGKPFYTWTPYEEICHDCAVNDYREPSSKKLEEGDY